MFDMTSMKYRIRCIQNIYLWQRRILKGLTVKLKEKSFSSFILFEPISDVSLFFFLNLSLTILICFNVLWEAHCVFFMHEMYYTKVWLNLSYQKIFPDSMDSTYSPDLIETIERKAEKEIPPYKPILMPSLSKSTVLSRPLTTHLDAEGTFWR